MAHDNGHGAHPVRNFFYTLYSLLNLLAFVGFFFAFYAIGFPMRRMSLVVTGAILLFALIFGVLRPLARRKR